MTPEEVAASFEGAEGHDEDPAHDLDDDQPDRDDED
jgi:hypothetical protein